ncbi:MAG: hypothetical protein NVS3B3_04450 [Aquirhabdus sp.]
MMVRVKTSELSGAALDWAVSECLCGGGIDEAIAAGDAVLINEQASLLRQCRAALDAILSTKPMLGAKEYKLGALQNSIGNLRAELSSYRPQGVFGGDLKAWSPSTNWAQGGPIKTRNLIATSPRWQNAGHESDTGYWYWKAYILGPENIEDSCEQSGETELIAAMRSYVASKLGAEVDVPEDFL